MKNNTNFTTDSKYFWLISSEITNSNCYFMACVEQANFDSSYEFSAHKTMVTYTIDDNLSRKCLQNCINIKKAFNSL